MREVINERGAGWGGERLRGRAPRERNLGAGRKDSSWFGVLVMVQDGFSGVIRSVLLELVLWLESQHVISRKNPLAFLSQGISVLLHGSDSQGMFLSCCEVSET